jgi:hypothetical protein
MWLALDHEVRRLDVAMGQPLAVKIAPADQSLSKRRQTMGLTHEVSLIQIALGIVIHAKFRPRPFPESPDSDYISLYA